MRFVREEPRTYAAGIALAVFVGLLELLGVSALIPALAAPLGDSVTGMPAIIARVLPTRSPVVVGIFLAVLILVQAGMNYLRESFFLTRMAQWRTSYSVDYVRAVVRSGWNGLGKLQPGEVEVMLARNIALAMKLRHMTANLIAEAILSAMYIGIALLISWYTSVLFLILGVLFAILHAVTVNHRMRYAVLAKERYVDVARRVIEHFADPRSIVLTGERVLLEKLRDPLRDAALAQLRNDQLNVFFLNIHQPILIVLSVIAVAILHMLGMPIATLGGIFYIFYRAAPRITNVARNYGVILGESPIDVIPEIVAWNARVPRCGAVAPRDASMRFAGVTLGYEGSDVLLRDVAIEARPGDLVCIRGKSGTGKSTILDAVCGFLVPRCGTLELGGVDARNLDWAAWRAQVGLVRPEGVIVSGSWTENIAFLDDAPDDARVEELITAVGLHDELDACGGISSAIAARGADLSAGQRQRILLARALYRRPRILLLDEPTSNLDAKTEEDIIRLILACKPTMTIVVVAHRDRILDHADRVYELTGAGTVQMVTV